MVWDVVSSMFSWEKTWKNNYKSMDWFKGKSTGNHWCSH
jgi:hypothetical protein